MHLLLCKNRPNVFIFSVYLRWDFHLEEGDIAFTVYRMEGCEFISIVPPNRVDCDMSTEEGEIRCDEPGVCKLRLPSTIPIAYFAL
jgi:hypothetical protein